MHIPFDSIFYAKRISDYVLSCSSFFFSVLHQKRYLEWVATDWSSDFTEKVWQKRIWYLGRKKVHLINHFSMTTAFAFYLTVIKLYYNKSWKLQVEMCCLLELCNFPSLFNTICTARNSWNISNSTFCPYWQAWRDLPNSGDLKCMWFPPPKFSTSFPIFFECWQVLSLWYNLLLCIYD